MDVPEFVYLFACRMDIWVVSSYCLLQLKLLYYDNITTLAMSEDYMKILSKSNVVLEI